MHTKKTCLFLGLYICVAFLISCTEILPNSQKSKITQASWDKSSNVLEVSGISTEKKSTSIQITSSSNNFDIAQTRVRSDATWKIKLVNPPVIPCEVIINNDKNTSLAVSNSPYNCDTQIPNKVFVNTNDDVTINSLEPDGVITQPIQNQTITAGESVTFSALASTTNVIYSWNFNGAVENYNIQNPGKITFAKPGSYRIKLTVKNTAGISDSTPDERLITVLPDKSQVGILAIPPTATILSPLANNVISVGDRLPFIADNANSNGTNSSIIYQWDFDSAAADSSVRAPGQVAFYKAGNFQISLVTIDQFGVRSQNTATVNVTVLANNGVNQAPTGIIQSPLKNSVITKGDVIHFSGAVTDPENNTPYSYAWDFDGAFANENVLDPGNKTFNFPGTYKITFTGTDSLGQSDTNPPSRFVTVNDLSINAAHLPDSTITDPAMDATFDIGTVVNFVGQGTSADGNVPFTFLWTFGGAAPDSMLEAPDPVTFDTAGVFIVTFTVTDSLAQADPTPAQIIITIVDPAATPPAGTTPVGEIIEPADDITITVGDAIDFMGSGTSSAGDGTVTYLWTFGGAAPDSTEQNPTQILFDTEGVFTVELIVTDTLGEVDPMPPSIDVTVEPAAAVPPPTAPDAPVGEITQPAQDMTIIVGDTLDFAGTGTSPVANDPVTYLWNFDGGAPDSTEQNPTGIMFNIEGIFEVSLTVTDSLGIEDPMPPTVIITVDPPAGTAPADPAPPADVPPADSPTGEILSPDEAETILVGESIEFIGAGESPIDSPLSFLWDFGGAAPEATVEEPGSVLFDAEGVYIITLTVTDEAGNTDPAPPSVEITVVP